MSAMRDLGVHGWRYPDRWSVLKVKHLRGKRNGSYSQVSFLCDPKTDFGVFLALM